MRFAQLRYAEAAIRLGSLRRAAEEQGIAQPSLSQQIKRLEEDLGVVLFVRQPSGVQATEAARDLLELVRKALRAEEHLRQSAAAVSELRSGFVRIGVAPTIGRVFMPHIVFRFQELYPNIRVELHESGSHSLREEVRNGSLDFALIPTKLDENIAGIWSVELFRSEYVVCLPKGHNMAKAESLTAEDLIGHPMVVHKDGYFSRSIFDALSRRYTLEAVVFADNTDAILRYVAGGAGVSLVPDIAVDVNSQEYDTVPFIGMPTTNRVALIRRSDEQPAPATQALMRLTRQFVKDILEQNSHGAVSVPKSVEFS